MSITLKTNQVKLKIQNGNYQAPVVIADQTTAEHVTEVNTAITATGNQQVSAIQTKGDEVLNSIPADYTELVEEVDNLKSALNETKNSIDTDKTKGKTKFIKSGTWINFLEKDITNVKLPAGIKATKHGRNRFNLDTATYTISSYSSSHTVTKENNGIKIVTNFSTDVGSQQVRFAYIAEFTGDLYISCDADCFDDSINALCMGVVINGTPMQQVYGRGHLLVVVPVTKNDELSVRFYSNISGNLQNTLFYKNIMFAYGGEYAYKSYSADEDSSYIYSKVILPTDKSKYSNESTDTPGLYMVRYDDLTITGLSAPQDAYTVPNAIVEGPLSLATNREVYTNNNGITISVSGKIRIYKDGIGVTNMMTFLQENPISLSYIVGIDDSQLSFEQGDSVSLESSGSVEYYGVQKTYSAKCVCFGDSITGMFAYGASYPDMITRKTDIFAYNVGFSGTLWADHTNATYLPFCMNRLADAVTNDDYTLQDASDAVNPNSQSYRPLYAEHLNTLKNISWEEIDYITIFFGTNDWDAGIPMKSVDDANVTDKQHTNEEDAIIYSIRALLTKYPHLRIIIITPYWRSRAAGEDSNIDKRHGEYLFDYAAFIGETAQNNFNIPTISLYRNLGANMLTNRFFTRDGTHPSELTKHIIAERIYSCINEYR